jgi:hypothetical protein
MSDYVMGLNIIQECINEPNYAMKNNKAARKSGLDFKFHVQ